MKKEPITIEKIYTVYKGLIITELRRQLHDTSLIEEALQETMLQINNSLTKIAALPEGAEAGYIGKIARYTAIKIFNREIKDQNRLVYVDEWEDFDPGSDFEIDKELAELRFDSFVSEYVEKLPELDNEIIHLVFYEDLSYAEISELLGISADNARQRLYRAKKRLKELLAEDERSKLYFK